MKEIDFKRIGRRIKEIRTSKGITQEYVANYANINTSHISNIENNRVKISLTTLVNVCNALDVTVDYVLAEEYNNSSSALEETILQELHLCSNDMKKRILKIVLALQ